MTSLTPTADRVIALAVSQVGYHEGRDRRGFWNNVQKFSPKVPGLEWSQGQAWCHTFLSWLAVICKITGLVPITASTDVGAAWFRKHGRWSEFPARGAWGYLGRGTDMHHVFLVERFDADWIWTVEGNTNNNGSPQGDGVYSLRRPRRGPGSPVGYGYPLYPEGIESADPAWASHAPARVAPASPAGPVVAQPSLVTQAKRLLLKARLNNAKNPVRRAKIEAGLAALPKDQA